MVAKNILSALVFAATCSGITMVNAQEDCARPYTVQQGDSCASISETQMVPTYQLAEANSQINLDCTNLSPGEQICLGIVGRDCNIVYTVQSGDTCPSIASNTGISVEQFLIDNPNIDAYCSNITPGDVVCVAPATTSA